MDWQEMSVYAKTQYESKYAHTINKRKEMWPETARRVVHSVMKPFFPQFVDRCERMVTERKFMPGGRYLNAAGRRDQYLFNCYLLKAEDSREGWADTMHWATSALMVGGGIGIVYSGLRPDGTEIKGLGGTSTGPLALMRMINESGRYIMQGGSRRSAIWAGLHWNHPDIFKFIDMKTHPEPWRELKASDFSFPTPMEGTNISVILDDDFFAAYHDPQWRQHYRLGGTSYEVSHEWAHDVYWKVVRSMLTNGEPGFSVDVGENAGEHLRNACTESTSRDNLDVCDLGSLNLGRYDTINEFVDDLPIATAFLIAGTLVSKLPIQGMKQVLEKNRRIGLGLMGVHEWLLKRQYDYRQNRELGEWLDAYATISTGEGNRFCDRLSIARSIAKRAVAPTGTISIVAETTSGGEPIPYVAYKRRYLKGTEQYAQYVIDPTAHRLIQQGVDPDLIEDSVSLAADVERRIDFQMWLQGFVDQGISSTINLPPWDSPLNNGNGVTRFGNALMKRLPKLRGITTYPDGSRGGQPFVKVPYQEAIKQVGVEFLDNSEQSCRTGVCSS